MTDSVREKSENMIRVVAFSTNQKGIIGQGLDGRPDFSVSWMMPTDPQAVAAKAPHLLIVDADLGMPCEAVIRAARNWAVPPAIITLGDIPLSDLRALIGHPRADALADNITADDLRELTRQVGAFKPTAESPSQAGECWAITGSVGGCGASLIAIETACQLRHRSKTRNKVCLIDLNFEDGSLATYLDLSPGLDLHALSGEPDRIDAALCSAFISEHHCGVDLIAAPRGASIGQTVLPESVLRLLEITCELYDYVVLDMPRWRQPWTAPIAQGADHLIIVSELTVPALHAARHLTEDLESISGNVAEPKVILNRMSKRVFGHSVSVGQAENALQRKTIASVSSDWDAAVSSVNMGMPVSFARPGAKMAKDIQCLVDLLTGEVSVTQNEKVA